MTTPIEMITSFLNNHLESLRLPPLSHQKTKVFVKMNNLLKKITDTEMVHLTKDYGLIFPALVLSDVNVDYAVILQGDTQIDVSGFVRYMDVFLITTTFNRNAVMSHFTNVNSNDLVIRHAWIQQELESMINTKGLSYEAIVNKLQKKYQKNR